MEALPAALFHVQPIKPKLDFSKKTPHNTHISLDLLLILLSRCLGRGLFKIYFWFKVTNTVMMKPTMPNFLSQVNIYMRDNLSFSFSKVFMTFHTEAFVFHFYTSVL